MVHWVYILRCSSRENIYNDKIYVGETCRLNTRLKEHVSGRGSCTTDEFYPNRLMGLYKVKNYFLLNDIEMYNMLCYDIFEEDKMDSRWLENNITEMYMQSMGEKWRNVYGGKYHNGCWSLRCKNSNPFQDKKFNRPYCKCKIPADINRSNKKSYWRCCRKNIYEKLQDYIVDELGLSSQDIIEPCNFYMEYREGQEFQCKDLIYTYKNHNIKLNGNCLLLSDSDDEE